MKAKAVPSGAFVTAWHPGGSQRWPRVSRGAAGLYCAFSDLSPMTFLPSGRRHDRRPRDGPSCV